MRRLLPDAVLYRRQPEAGAQRRLEAVGFRVEPAVAQPAPPQTRTCAINAYGSSVTRVSAPLWCITFAALHSHIRWCERSWVWAERASPTAFGTSPSRSHSYYCDG